MSRPHDLPDLRLDPPSDPPPPCPCGFDGCDCDPDACQVCGLLDCCCPDPDDEPEDEDDGDPYREPFEIGGEDEPIPEDE